MRKDLEYPFDPEYILKKSKHIKKELLADGTSRICKRIAVLGGSTTHDVIRILELFLLNQGIEPVFYESEYGQYWKKSGENGIVPSSRTIWRIPFTGFWAIRTG